MGQNLPQGKRTESALNLEAYGNREPAKEDRKMGDRNMEAKYSCPPFSC
jgi:hypothetical protein